MKRGAIMTTALSALTATAIGASGACGGRQGDLLVQDGVELARAGKVDEARARFKKALAVSPSTPGARTGMASLAKDPARALEHLDAELAAHPTLAEARFDRARLHVASGDPVRAKAALEDLEALGELAAADPDVVRLRELARFIAGESAVVPEGLEAVTISHRMVLDAFEAWQRAPGEAPIPEPVLALAPRLRAASLARATKWDEALAALPVQPETTLDRATCLAWLDRLDEARALVAEALRATPDDPRAQALAAALD